MEPEQGPKAALRYIGHAIAKRSASSTEKHVLLGGVRERQDAHASTGQLVWRPRTRRTHLWTSNPLPERMIHDAVTVVVRDSGAPPQTVMAQVLIALMNVNEPQSVGNRDLARAVSEHAAE